MPNYIEVPANIEYSMEIGSPVIILNIISIVFAVLFTLIYIMQHVHAVTAMLTKNKVWPEAKKYHKYGFLIAGRNEANVIGQLIDSIRQQDYPQDKIEIFVCADNCTDETSAIARSKGAIVYERFDTVSLGKSYAMDYLIKRILSNDKFNDIECFLVFDADNLVSKSYLKEMNKTFDAGYEVSTSFRESKNFDHNWISGCSSLTFYRECCLVHHSRQKFNLGTYVSGTGYFVSRRIVEQLGNWDFNTMTEDIEFSIWCATNDIQISYNEDAVFYDEQPESLKVANTQRLRWCKGTHQCCGKYDDELFKSMFIGKKKMTNYELFAHVTPFPIITLLWLIIYIMSCAVLLFLGEMDLSYFTRIILQNCLGFIFTIVIVSQVQALFSVIRNKERLKKYNKWFIAKCVLLFPIYVSMFIPLSIKALFKRKVVWKQIPHTNKTSIDKLEKATANK